MGSAAETSGHSRHPESSQIKKTMEAKLLLPSVAAILLLCLVDQGTGIKCYKCNSYEDPLCVDPFSHPNGDIKSMGDHEEECDADTPEKEHFCRKIYQNVRGEERVIRGCGWIKDDKQRPCYTTVLEEYNTEVCQCDTELCNSATLSSISVLTILSSMALGYLIH